jgi:adrenodoxin-NADP+ reductase
MLRINQSAKLSRKFSSQRLSLKVAIIGSGPAGFYTADKILSLHPEASIDLFESLSFPHGLARYGVAPDHPEVKNVTHKFDTLLSDERVRWFGNVALGRDFYLEDVKRNYDAVVLAYGASQDRKLGVVGEGDLLGLWSAREFVAWYNGHPSSQKTPDLNTDTAVIVGQGNVALDIARLLLSSVDVLRKTDITLEALEAISTSKIKRVVLVGRRGPAQVAFTAKEVREMANLPNCKLVLDDDYAQQVSVFQSIVEKERAKKRILQIIEKQHAEANLEATREWHLKFLLSPSRIDSVDGSVTGIAFTKNKLEYPNLENLSSTSSSLIRAVPIEGGDYIQTGLLIKSIGYKSEQVDDSIPFDYKKGLVPNNAGRVTKAPAIPSGIAHELVGSSFTRFIPSSTENSKLYVSGWLKRGPTGVIASTMMDAHETAQSLVNDLKQGLIIPQAHSDELVHKLSLKTDPPLIAAKDWSTLDAFEKEQGALLGKDRLKLKNWQEASRVL